MTYYPHLDVVYVLDNSEKINQELINRLKKLSKVKYISHGENLGISYSLNETLKLVKDQYQWLLTMDQDSSFKKGMLVDYLKCLDEIPNGVYGLTSVLETERLASDEKLKVVDGCITSGNLINVGIALEVHGFDENLFIDEVDYDFCYKCNNHGYKLLAYQKRIMNHVIGDPVVFNFLGRRIYSMNHSYIRDYYIIRNRLYVSEKYPQIRKKYVVKSIKEIIIMMLAEKDRLRKMRFIIKGLWDYKRRKMGKLSV